MAAAGGIHTPAMRLTLPAVTVIVLASLAACGPKETPPDPSRAPAAASSDAPKKTGTLALPAEESAAIEAVAREALTAYKSKDLAKLAAVGPPGAKDKLIFLEPRNPHYAELLGDDTWRMKSLAAWDGQTLMKVESGVDVAFAWYHQDETQRYGVELRKDPDPAKNNEKRWMFHDLVQKPKP